MNFWHFRLKNQLPPLFFSIFAIFRPHFHQLFATITPKTLETWKTSGEKSTSVSCFSSFEAKKVKFYKLFAKILRWSLENLKNQLTSGEFLSHPVEKIIFKHFSIFRPNFHQLFAKIMKWSFRNLEKQLTSGKNQLTFGQKSADIRFRFNHLTRVYRLLPKKPVNYWWNTRIRALLQAL